MTNHKWDLKTNYMLASTVCKYELKPESWNLIANDLMTYINVTPKNCKTQFDSLCQQYDQDWKKQSIEPLHTHVCSILKSLYCGDLCGQMDESRYLLNAIYDFICLFKGGRITSNDISELLQDIKNTDTTGIHLHDKERQEKIKILSRLQGYMSKQVSHSSDVQLQHSSLPVELLPPPPFFQQPPQPILENYNLQDQSFSTINENDRQVPSMNGYQNSNNLLIENEGQSLVTNQSNEIDIDEIELSSDDEDDDDNDRTAIAQISAIDEQVTNSNLVNDQDESNYISDEPMETNESSNIPPIPAEGSNSNDRDLYDNVSSSSISNQSTFDTRLSAEEQATSSINAQPGSSNLQLNASASGSSDYVTMDGDREVQSFQNHHLIPTESMILTPGLINIEYDEAARMDAEQIPEPVPADLTDVAVPNDNAVFIVDEFVSNKHIPKISTTNIDEKSVASDVTLHEMDITSELHENADETMTRRTSRSHSRLTTSSMSHHFRKSINSILSNLKNTKYGSDFAKPLKSFKLPDEYYIRIKKPLDIPEIRERMYNGDYDENILLFERDILLMFTNALCMYDREVNIHEHAQYMMNYAIELLTPIDEVVTPWKTSNDLNENKTDDGDSSSIHHPDNGNDSDDTTLNRSLSTRTPSLGSTSSSIRRQGLPTSLTEKRQRKTTH